MERPLRFFEDGRRDARTEISQNDDGDDDDDEKREGGDWLGCFYMRKLFQLSCHIGVVKSEGFHGQNHI